MRGIQVVNIFQGELQNTEELMAVLHRQTLVKGKLSMLEGVETCLDSLEIIKADLQMLIWDAWKKPDLRPFI